MTENLSSQFRQLLTATAKKRWTFQRPITIVIDALDECDGIEHQVELLKLILEAVTTSKMRFLIVSRPEHQIHAFFQRQDVSQHTYHVRLDEETFNTSRDIEVFLRAEFARIRREKPNLCLPLPNGEEWPGNVIIIRIRDDSDSQFIFPTLAIAFIDTPFYTPDQQLQILLAVPPPRAFSKLDALYERILSRCPPDLREGSDELVAYQNRVLDILAVVVAWSEPIHATTIAGVLKTRVDVVQNIVLGLMRSLFKVDSSEPNPLITLCHKSLRDYLLDIERSRKFFIPSSDTDALFISILSRSPPSESWYSRDELKEVLMVLTNWSAGLNVSDIANVLDIDPRLVQSVVFGPARALFHEDTDGNIQLSTSSFKYFLHDVARSRDFFVQAEVPEAIFIRILSHPTPSNPLYSYSRDDLLDVLTAVLIRNGQTTESEIKASLLGVDVNIIRRVVLGPAAALFHTSNGEIQFSTSSLRPFLQDTTRSGEFHIRGRDETDAIFIRILSRQPPSDPPRSYSREVLMGVLSMVIERESQIKVPEIASFLDVAPRLVEGVIFGPTKVLFKLDSHKNVGFTFSSFKAFLLDADRARELFPGEALDTHFTRILSRQPPSHPSQSYSRELSMDVLSMVVARENWINAHEIASFLDVALSLVEGVIFGPAKALFKLHITSNVAFAIPSFDVFLLDANRAGEFFIPRNRIDTHFIQILSHQPSSPSQPYSHKVLMGVLEVLVVWSSFLSVSQIASTLDVDSATVKAIVSGTEVFYIDDDDGDVQLLPYVEQLLQDPNRAGECYIPSKDLNPNYGSMYAKIEKIRDGRK